MTHMAMRAGIRELRQNLSRYVERVKAGETIEVTERGRPVALLTPCWSGSDALSALEARGLRVTRASADASGLADVPQPAPGARPLSELLLEQRQGERF